MCFGLMHCGTIVAVASFDVFFSGHCIEGSSLPFSCSPPRIWLLPLHGRSDIGPAAASFLTHNQIRQRTALAPPKTEWPMSGKELLFPGAQAFRDQSVVGLAACTLLVSSPDKVVVVKIAS